MSVSPDAASEEEPLRFIIDRTFGGIDRPET
jgi:hypothetical protein